MTGARGELLRALGGRIEVTSQIGVGTTFVVTLPREAATGGGAAEAPQPEPMTLAAE